MTIVQTNKGFEISFPFDRVKIAAVKRIKGAWFRGQDKTWVVPRHQNGAVEQLKQRFSASEATPVLTMPEMFADIPDLPELDIKIPLKRELYPYQGKGVAYSRIHRRVMIGDAPGLGKSTQAIATIVSFGSVEKMLNLGPGLIICPAIMKTKWQREWMTVAGKRTVILDDSNRNTWHNYLKAGMVDVFITNYESLKKFFVQGGWNKPVDGPFKINMIPFKECINLFKWVVVDESHKVKDPTTQRTKFTTGICKGKEWIFELTGTPFVNKPQDLISQLVIMDRLKDIVSHIPQPQDKNGKATDYSGYTRFINRYCDGGAGATNLRELNYRLNHFCYFRREKKDVLKDLPDKTRQIMLCDISTRPEYKKAEDDFVDYLKSVKGCTDKEIKKKLRGEVLVKFGILKQISAKGKMASVKEFVDNIIDCGEKMVLFCNLQHIVEELKSLFPGAVTLYGKDSTAQRDENIRRFQTDPSCRVIVCNIISAGVGIDLYAASESGFVEFPWTSADCEQCEDRLHRIGQKKNVRSTYFLGENTIDRYCYELIQRKRSIGNSISGARDDVAEEVIDELLNLFNRG
jgi:SWI/SNF-related matrix-associated actin-dependent regulator 1 of chromatin subfamily A